MMQERIRRLEVILKVAERCNIACSYCYYFYHGDDSYKKRKPTMDVGTVERVAEFLRTGCIDLQIPCVSIVFHGGEPLLMKKEKFALACMTFRKALSGITKVELAVQTNGMLLDQEWLDIMDEHDVDIGISIDGPKEINDRSRIDHKGRGTYERTRMGIRLAVEHSAARHKSPRDSRMVGVLTVLNAECDYGTVVRHFSRELGVRTQGFLLPDCSYEDGIPGGFTARDYGRSLCEIFDAWLVEPGLRVREIDKFIGYFQRVKTSEHQNGEYQHRGWYAQGGRNQIIVIHSDGAIGMDDTYIPAKEWRSRVPTRHIESSTLAEYLAQPIFDEIAAAYRRLPEQCSACVWQNLCGAGDLENRYSTENGFDNPSIFCEGLKMFYTKIVRYLVRNGYPSEELYAQLRPRDIGPHDVAEVLR